MKGSLLFGLLAVPTLTLAYPASSSNITSLHRPVHPGQHGMSAVSEAAQDAVQYYLAWFYPPSGAIITDLVATMSVPNISPNPPIGPRYVWPGLENIAGDFVFQDVIGDYQQAGRWTFATWYVGEGEEKEYTLYNTEVGDTIDSHFNLRDAGSNTWTESFTMHGADATSGSIGTVSFKPNQAMTSALLAIEVRGGSQWDFGQVTFSDISITSNSPDTNWCNPDFQTSPSIGDFQHYSTAPQATVNGQFSTCSISQVVFQAP